MLGLEICEEHRSGKSLHLSPRTCCGVWYQNSLILICNLRETNRAFTPDPATSAGRQNCDSIKICVDPSALNPPFSKGEAFAVCFDLFFSCRVMGRVEAFKMLFFSLPLKKGSRRDLYNSVLTKR